MLRIVIRQAEGNLKAGWILAVRFSIFAGHSDEPSAGGIQMAPES
jgi:hypothetical protein